MTSPNVPRWIPILIVLTAVASIASLYFRYRVEARNLAVGISVEASAAQEMGAAQGFSFARSLQSLKLQGLTAVVMSEELTGDLIAADEIRLRSTGDGFVVEGDPFAVGRLARGIQVRYPKVRMSDVRLDEGHFMVHDLSGQLIRTVPVGLNPGEAAVAKSLGLQIISRHGNPSGASDVTVRETLRWANELGSTVFLPQGDQVLGRRDNVQVLVDTLEELDMIYASAEFSKIGGDQAVIERAPDNLVRLHAAQAAELDKLTFEAAIERYVKSVRERNHRLLMLRPVSNSAPEPLTEFGLFVKAVRDTVDKEGYQIGNPHPFSRPGMPKALYLVIALFTAPVIWWTASVVVTNRALRIAGALLLGLLALACYMTSPNGRQYMAFFAALAFPIAAYIIMDARKPRSWPIEYVIMSLVSLVGGLVIAGLLNDIEFYIRAQQFRGVNIAHFLPIGFIGLYFFMRSSNVGEALGSPIRWIQAVTALVLLVALAFMFTRTGNDNPAGVSGAEVQFRETLDALLMVRPRTKEFLIGHPALIIGIGMLALTYTRTALRGRGWIPVLMMVGAIGQTSIVNTMAHLHTPLTLGLARIGVGLVAGGIIGAVLWAGVKRWRLKEEG